MPRTHHARFAPLLAALALAALAAACAGEAELTSDSDTAPPATDAPAADADEPDDGEPAAPVDPDITIDEEAPGSAAPEPSTPAHPVGSAPNPDPAAEVEPDGTWHALIQRTESGQITLDRIEILSGEEAARARAEDGQPPLDDTHEQVYLRNRNTRLRTVPVASDVTVQVYECSQGCALVPWRYGDMVSGRPLPYGSAETPFLVTVRGGTVTALTELYLP